MDLSDTEVMLETLETTDGQRVTAQFKDGQLQIVEVTPFDKTEGDHILPGLHDDGENSQDEYLQVLDGDGDGVVRLDLLNLTLVRCLDGQESYQLLANAEPSDVSELDGDGSTVTCVLQASGQSGIVSVAVDDQCDDNSYVMVNTESPETPYVLLKTVEDVIQEPESPQKPMSPTVILEKAKALQKVKAMMSSESTSGGSGRGRSRRKRKSDLPPPHELLASPNFKLYLYSCKLCSFRCNAVKEMSVHKAVEHSAGAAGSAARRGGSRGPSGAVSLQCAKCPFRGNTHLHLVKHVQEKHTVSSESAINVVSFTESVQLDTAEVEAADILVCGACGFESGHRPLFRKHIEDEHGATTC